MQYSHLPSWMSFLVDRPAPAWPGATCSTRSTTHWSRLPADSGPSSTSSARASGSFGGETAFSGETDLANRTDGVLFVGPPNFNPLYREFVDTGTPGSAEVEPVYREGRTSASPTARARASRPRTSRGRARRVLYLQHAVGPDHLVEPRPAAHRPDWLEETRGADVSGAMRWIPLVTFWQVTADLALGFSTPPGHGHNFCGEHVDGWNASSNPRAGRRTSPSGCGRSSRATRDRRTRHPGSSARSRARRADLTCAGAAVTSPRHRRSRR